MFRCWIDPKLRVATGQAFYVLLDIIFRLPYS